MKGDCVKGLIMQPQSSSVCNKVLMASSLVAADSRFLHLWVVSGSVMSPVWNPVVKPCMRQAAREGAGCENR